MNDLHAGAVTRNEIPLAPFVSWRDILPIHPAAEMFPLLSRDELLELGDDIKKNGISMPIAIYLDYDDDGKQLDGRNRLDAMELVAVKFPLSRLRGRPQLQLTTDVNDFPNKLVRYIWDRDPYQYVVSANAHRRHLTAEQKRDVIAKVLKAEAELSDRQIANIAKVDHKTVASVRDQLEGRGEIPHVGARTDSRGRVQPARKSRPKNGIKREQRQQANQRGQEENQRHEERNRLCSAAAAGLIEKIGPDSARLAWEFDDKHGSHGWPIVARLLKDGRVR